MSNGLFPATDKISEAIDLRYAELKEEEGRRYASVMEGYGNLVSAMSTVEAYFKSCKKTVTKFGSIVGSTATEQQRDVLEDMERQTAIMTTASMVMAAKMRLFRDTVVDIGGGNLLDILDAADK